MESRQVSLCRYSKWSCPLAVGRLVLPADMTSVEIDRLCIELHELGANTLTPLVAEAVALELADPASAKREPWDKL